MTNTKNTTAVSVYRPIVAVSLSMLFSLLVLAYITSRLGAAASLGVAILVGVGLVMVLWPETATMAVMFVLYSNLAVVAVRQFHVNEWVAALGALPLSIPLASYLLVRRVRIKTGLPLVLMVVFLICMMLSSFFAKDPGLAAERITTYLLEGLLLYFLVFNVIRDMTTLKRVLWVLVLGAALLGGLSLYQAATGSYNQQFGGLAQRNLSLEEETDQTPDKFGHKKTTVHLADRSGGPLGSPNRYAQNELMVLPLALFLLWNDKSRVMRVVAAGSAVLILSAVLLSYSRGAFVTLAVLLLLFAMVQRRRRLPVLAAGALVIVLVLTLSPGYSERMKTLLGVEGLFSQEASVRPDSVTRGRTTEMLAALHVFLDYPVFGVGPGQYAPFYSMAYHMNPEIALRVIPKTRRAHSLYAELAAETGIVGLIVFFSIVGLILHHLWQARRRWSYGRPDLAQLATAFVFSILAYLGTAVFLHLSYERYYWLLLAVASAALQIGYAEYQASRSIGPVRSAPVRSTRRLF